MIALLIVLYVIIGLFISRWWWRLTDMHDATEEEDVIIAFGIVICWPLFLIGTAIFVFARWFYSRPPRKRS